MKSDSKTKLKINNKKNHWLMKNKIFVNKIPSDVPNLQQLFLSYYSVHALSSDENPSTLSNISEIKVLKLKNSTLRVQCNIMKRG